MFEAAWAEEEAVVDDEVFGGADESDAVAGGIDEAIGDEGIFPEPAGDAVVAGVELAVGDGDVFAGVVFPAAEVNAIPTAGDFEGLDGDVGGEFEHDGVVSGVFDGEVLEGDIFGVAEEDGMWAAHAFFAAGVEDLVAVDGTAAGDGDVLDVDAEEECAVPAVAGSEGRGAGGVEVLVEFGVRVAGDFGSGVDFEGDIAFEVDGSGEVVTRGEEDEAVGCKGGGVDGFVDGGGVVGFAVAGGAVVADVEDGGFGSKGEGEECEEEKSDGGAGVHGGLLVQGVLRESTGGEGAVLREGMRVEGVGCGSGRITWERVW